MLYVGNTGDAGIIAILGIGVAFFIFGFIIFILGYGVGIVVCCKHRKNKDGKFLIEFCFTIACNYCS